MSLVEMLDRLDTALTPDEELAIIQADVPQDNRRKQLELDHIRLEMLCNDILCTCGNPYN